MRIGQGLIQHRSLSLCRGGSLCGRCQCVGDDFCVDAQQVQIGWYRAVWAAEAIDIEDTGIDRASLLRDLLSWIRVNRAFAKKNDGDVVVSQAIDNLADLLQRTNLIGVYRPQI